MEDVGATWQLGGPNAFNRYGFDEQVPNRLYVYNNRLSGVRTIGAVTLVLIKVANQRLGQTEALPMADGRTAMFSSRTRTLIDAIRDADRFGTLPRAFGWVRQDLVLGKTTPAELVEVALVAGDKATRRRLGVLLEREGVAAKLLDELEQSLSSTQSTIPYDPTRPKRGRWSRRWGVIVNDQDPVA
jgi:predicted transcriptional regulator of viral defense system